MADRLGDLFVGGAGSPYGGDVVGVMAPRLLLTAVANPSRAAVLGLEAVEVRAAVMSSALRLATCSAR